MQTFYAYKKIISGSFLLHGSGSVWRMFLIQDLVSQYTAKWISKTGHQHEITLDSDLTAEPKLLWETVQERLKVALSSILYGKSCGFVIAKKNIPVQLPATQLKMTSHFTFPNKKVRIIPYKKRTSNISPKAGALNYLPMSHEAMTLSGSGMRRVRQISTSLIEGLRMGSTCGRLVSLMKRKKTVKRIRMHYKANQDPADLP